MRICYLCKKYFMPSSKHKNCPSCRYQKTKTLICCICKNNIHSNRYSNCRSCTNRKREDYGTGRYLKKGYVMVFQKNHPRASNNNYVLEHVIIIEKYLGRLLLPHENIHHKNGIKNDNRIENLELWIKPQPSGIRAVDAVDWAKKILADYEPVKDKL